MFRTALSLVAVSAALAIAQSPGDLFEKAPPAVDEALRDRISKFYQAHVDAKWRQADKVVAEDSKDQFFAMSKPVYKTFEILKLSYSDNFSKATAVTVVERELNVRGNTFLTKAPVTTTWKIEDGQWCWYVDEKAGGSTPMGPSDKTTVTAQRPAGMPKDFGEMMTDPKRRAELITNLTRKVSVAKTEIQFELETPGSDSVLITNDLEGPIRVSLSPDKKIEGLTVDLDKQEIPGGSKGSIRFRYLPVRDASPSVLKIAVEIGPTGQLFPIEVRVGRVDSAQK